MKKAKQVATILCGALVVSFHGVGTVTAADMDDIVFRDGSIVRATEVAESAESSAGSAPFHTNVMELNPASLERSLIANDVDLSQVDVEAIAAMKPYPIQRESMESKSTETVLGTTDARTRNYTDDYPSNAVVLITFQDVYGSSYICSGWLVGSNTVITAGHCVHDQYGVGWHTNFTVYPGYNNGAPYGSCGVSNAGTVLGWIYTGHPKYDYGALRLDCTVGNTVGWFGFNKKGRKNKPTRLTGYPADKSPYYSQWESADRVAIKTNRQLFYSNDTYGGMSGSPVWSDICNIGACVHGIHAYGPYGSGRKAEFNRATRINKHAYNNIYYWKNDW